MNPFTLYHHPQCSKSREALKRLQSFDIQPNIIEYMNNPLTIEQLQALRHHFELKDFVRSNEPMFKAMKLTLNDEDAVLHAMSKAPILMQRPIVTYDKYAVIARPIENLMPLIHRFLSCHPT